ncbi:MAG: response regulator [Bacteroidetes bacterium]|nr:response regulator [Bacteroidota bacterium]
MKRPVILIADDEHNIRETVSQALENMASNILLAGSIAEIWSILEKEAVEVLFLDLRFPDGDGQDVLRSLHVTHPQIVVIVMTAFGDIESAVNAMRLGAADFLRKPFSPQSLRQSLASVFGAREKATTIDDVMARLHAARESIHAKELPAAEEQLRAVLATDPLSAPAFNLLGIIREIQRNNTDAQVFYRLAITADLQYGPANANLERIGTWPHSGTIDFGSEETDHVTHS